MQVFFGRYQQSSLNFTYFEYSVKMKKFSFVLILTFFCCNSSQKDKQQRVDLRERNIENDCLGAKDCDSVYIHDSGFLLCLSGLDRISPLGNWNYVFKVYRMLENECVILFSDSVFSKTGELSYVDFNNDGIMEILIQNNSDVRSNWTYYIYYINENSYSINKVDGFSYIKNPKSLPNTNLIESYVVSGSNYYEYYQISNDFLLCKFDTVIYENRKLNEQFDSSINNKLKIDKVRTLNCIPVHEVGQ